MWQASQAHADEAHGTEDTEPVGDMAVPRDDANWDYQAGRPGRTAHSHMVACLIVGLQKAGHKANNSDKLWLITQGLDRNCTQFLARLTEALQKYTRLDPTSAEDATVLNTHFIFQLSPDM